MIQNQTSLWVIQTSVVPDQTLSCGGLALKDG